MDIIFLTMPVLRKRFYFCATQYYNQLFQNLAFLCWKVSKRMVHWQPAEQRF